MLNDIFEVVTRECFASEDRVPYDKLITIFAKGMTNGDWKNE